MPTCRCRGRVLTDVEVVLAGGGEAIADIAVLGHQCALLGPVASAPTVWRTLAELSAARLAKVDEARARVRRHVWSQLPGGVPASKVADSIWVTWWCSTWTPPSWWPTVRRRPRHQQGQLRVSSDRGVV